MELSKLVQSIGESPTLAVSALAARMRSEGIDVVGFGAGEPDFDTPQHIIDAASEALNNGHTKYPKPSSGLPVLKEAIKNKLKRENNLSYETNQITVTVGGKMACNLLIKTLINPGDEVIIPTPYWVSYPEFVRLAGGKPVFIQGTEDNGFCVTPEQIRAVMTDRTRVLLLNYPSNPGGHMYSPERVRAIADALVGTNITVIADEIYDRLVLDGTEFLSFAAVSDDACQRTITVNSASKTYSMTGWRIGFVAGNSDVVKGVAKLDSQGSSGAATFSQVAYAAALDGDQSCVETMRAAFVERAARMHQLLNDIPGVRCPKSAGAFYAFPNVGGTFKRLNVSGSAEFTEKLLSEANVAVVPGIAFGMDEHVRFSFATSMDNIEKGLERMRTWIEKH